MSAPTEIVALVVRARDGDVQAFEEIHARFKEMAFAYAFSILGDRDAAEDARQEAFLDAYVDLVSLQQPAAFPAWFKAILRNRSLTIGRGRKMLTVPFDEAPEPASRTKSPADAAADREQALAVREAVERLSAPDREVVTLYYLQDLSQNEIASILGLPIGTIKSRLFSAREKLQALMLEKVKISVRKSNRSGEKPALDAATDDAIELFGRQAGELLRTPTSEEMLEAAELLFAKGRLERFRGRLADALKTFQQAERIPAVRRNPLGRARAQIETGLVRLQSGAYDAVREAMTRARKTLDARSAPLDARYAPLPAVALNALGTCEMHQGNLEQARETYETTCEAAREAQLPEIEAEAVNNLGLIDWKQGRLAEALEKFQRSVKQWRRVGNRFGETVALLNIGVVEERQGRFALARRHYGQARDLAVAVEYRQAQGALEANLASLALLERRWKTALQHAGAALEIAEKTEDRRSRAIALENLALAHTGTDEFDAAQQDAALARNVAHELGDRERLASLDLTEAELSLRRGRSDEAARYAASAATQIDQVGLFDELPRLLRIEAEILTARGAPPAEIEEQLGKARREAERLGVRAELKRIEPLEKRLDRARRNRPGRKS